jgi:hypothetical protein
MEYAGDANVSEPNERLAFRLGSNESNSSGVTWSAVFAGGVVSAALSLILLALGSGLGFASVSVWSGVGASASAVGTAAILWFILIQILSSSMGGYLAGRLRTKWTGIHNDEVYFRDTAHGFLAWSVALVVTAAFLASAATSLIGSAPSRAATTSTSQSRADEAQPYAYFVDSLFRNDGSKPEVDHAASTREAGTIFVASLERSELSTEDKAYLDQLVISKTGLSQSEADKRVSETFMNAKLSIEATRKAIAHTLLWAFIALLMGAFCASLFGTIGGKQRDSVITV